MGTLVNLQHQTEQLQGFQLNVPQDMMDALNYLSTQLHYVGGVNVFTDPSGTGVTWQLSLQSTTRQGSQGVGVIGDWIILQNNNVATFCAQANFAALYHT